MAPGAELAVRLHVVPLDDGERAQDVVDVAAGEAVEMGVDAVQLRAETRPALPNGSPSHPPALANGRDLLLVHLTA